MRTRVLTRPRRRPVPPQLWLGLGLVLGLVLVLVSPAWCRPRRAPKVPADTPDVGRIG
ncbi:hypothetical protein [Microbacterium sp. MYb62]|uniref:hypothetical protein n=1 Tax=Microbacterium sp. MYb62 TaxID=1848690 RepID=UPI0015E41148|nr:hypothetical protein [Microbacterium sp. MYb62]